jgi:hypothetical protein
MIAPSTILFIGFCNLPAFYLALSISCAAESLKMLQETFVEAIREEPENITFLFNSTTPPKVGSFLAHGAPNQRETC